MSEYPGYSNKKPQSIEDLSPGELKGTLFDPANSVDEDRIVDTRQLSYSEARAITGLPSPNEPITDKQKYPYWTMEEYYERRLALLSSLGNIAMHEGFGVASQYSSDIQQRYGEGLPAVQNGAQGRLDRDIYLFRALYGERELNESRQFNPQDIRDDANLMLSQMRHKYSGSENRSKRQKEQKRLAKRLEQLRSPKRVA